MGKDDALRRRYIDAKERRKAELAKENHNAET